MPMKMRALQRELRVDKGLALYVFLDNIHEVETGVQLLLPS
jgi:hypothetical protein